MKQRKVITGILLVVIFLILTAGAVAVSVRRVSLYAQGENSEKTALVQKRVDETLKLLNDLSKDEYISNMDISFEEKAEFLTDKNVGENLGYMMLRILDEDINIYKEGIGLASNLGSRDYMQKMYATGEQQVTDAFLAGADGTTINYTLTAAIQKDGQVVGALMAAIYGTEIDEDLASDKAVNVLVGSQLQYMGGISREQFGLAVAQVLESELNTSRPVENILLDFHDQKGGSFWGVGDGIQYFAYTPVDHCEWIVMTEVNALPIIKNILIVYGILVVLLIITGIALCKPQKGTGTR